MADADGDQFHRAAPLDHGDDVAQVFFQIVRGVHRQGGIVHRRAVRDHHHNLARLWPRHHAAMRPFQRFAVDVFLQQALFHHQSQIGPCSPPWGICGFIDDVAQIVQAAGLLRATLGQPFFAALATFPGAGGKAENLDLDRTTFQRARQNIGTDRGDTDGAAPHRAGVVQ